MSQPASQSSSKAVTILGAGVIGLATAARLQQEGWAVTLIDRKGIGQETSIGNAGGIAHTDVNPLASPDTIRSAISWLFDPLGPLAIRPKALPGLTPWFWRFAKAGLRGNFERNVKAIAALNSLAEPAWLSLWKDIGLPDQRRTYGCLDLYENPKAFARAQGGYQRQRDHGIEVQMLDHAGAVHQMEPDLGPKAQRAAFIPGWAAIDDPALICQRLGTVIQARGGRFITAAVDRITPQGGSDHKVAIGLENGDTHQTSHLIIAGGVWSGALTRMLGDKVALTSERGYNTTIPDPGVTIRHTLLLPEHGFILSPLAPGLRVGGAVEFAGLKAPPNYQRANRLLAKAKEFVPTLSSAGGKQWMGNRPCTPDTLPVISPSSAGPHILYAFGHGHYGLTQAAATARLIADMMAGRPAAIDMAPYRASRF